MESGIDIAIANLKSELNSLKMDLSERRKKGFDTRIAELHIINIPSKVQMAEVTKDLKDVQKVTQLLMHVRDELQQSKPKDEYIMMKDAEIEYEAPPDALAQIKKSTQDAYAAIAEKRMEQALLEYERIRGIYKLVSEDMKKQVYLDILNIHKKIMESRK